MRASLAKKAAVLARQKGHPEAVAVAMVDPDAEVIEATDLKTGGTRLILRSELEADRGRFQAVQTRKEPGTVLTVTVRRCRVVRPGPGRQRRRGAQGALRPARQGDPRRRSELGRLARHDPHRSLRELAAALRRGVHAGHRAQAAGHRPAGHHLGPGVPALLLEPLPERHRRSARDHPVPDRAGQPGRRDFRVPRLRHLRHERNPAHALQHRAGQPHFHLADPRLRIPGAGPHAACK